MKSVNKSMMKRPVLRKLVQALCMTTALAASAASFAGTDTLSPSVYKKLTQVQEVMGAGDFKSAIVTLKALDSEVSSSTENTLNEAIVKQTLGFAYMSAENYDAAIVAFKRSLELDKLPQNAADNVRYLIAQLYAGKGDYKTAMKYAEIWFKQLAEPKATDAIFMANLYAQLKMFRPAAELAELGIKLSDDPRQSWFQLAVAAYFEDKRYKEAAGVLQKSLERWPEEAKMWEQLASVYMAIGNADKALAVLKVAWRENLLEKETTIKSMIQLAGSNGIPEHAARLLTVAIDKGMLPADVTYLQLLANAWTVARENDQAIAALQRLAEVSPDGEPWLKQGRLYLDAYEWQAAEQALQKALKKGVNKPGQAWLLLGITRVEQEQFGEAIDALKKAEAFDKEKSQAVAWQRYVDDKRKQQQWLTRNDS